MLSRLFITALRSPAWKRADLLALVGDVYCVCVSFPCGILGQVWYLIVSFPDLCRLPYFNIINACLRPSPASIYTNHTIVSL